MTHHWPLQLQEHVTEPKGAERQKSGAPEANKDALPWTHLVLHSQLQSTCIAVCGAKQLWRPQCPLSALSAASSKT